MQSVPIVSNISGYTNKHVIDNNNTDYNDNTDLISCDRYQYREYTKIYNALKDLEEYNVKISIPEFVFIGFQSSGKTSAVSQAAKLALGVMKCGAASRCPTRFKLISNPKQKRPLISVNGEICKDEADLTKKTSDITKQYEEQRIFSKNIIEVRIESAQVPELTFVDLPGLIKGDNKEFETVKHELDILTAHFLSMQNPNGSYRYIPILVREPVDKEHDTHFEVNYIDQLIEKYGHRYSKRTEWKEDALFIVNKFDKQINRSPALSLINYMKYCCEDGETVLTMMNPTDANTANMGQEELNGFVLSVELLEKEKWSQVLKVFHKKNDMDLNKLIELKQDKCGIAKMNEILAKKMCEIVKKIIPSIEQQLDLAEKEKKSKIDALTTQCCLCDPDLLKSQCIKFNNVFLQYLREFYAGTNILQINNKYKKSWFQEMNDFHIISLRNSELEWKYEISPGELEIILSKSIENQKKRNKQNKSLRNRQNKDKEDKIETALTFKKSLKLQLIGCAALDRIINAWKCQISYMPFPEYSNEDIMNAYSSFDATMQPQLWPSVKNVVLDAVSHLSDAATFLAQMLTYKLKENADIVFQYTLLKLFGTSQLTNDSILKLLQRTLKDYKLEIDNIMNEFIDIASVGPKNLAQILDETFCEETINIGRLIDQWKPPKKEEMEHITSPSPPTNHKDNPLSQRSQSHILIMDEDNDDDNDDDDDDDMKQIEEPKHNVISKHNVIETGHDLEFYELVYLYSRNHPIEFKSNCYNIELIQHLSFIFWRNFKQITTRDTIQKLSNRVMAHIKQKDARIANSIQCGVGRQRVQYLIKQLVDTTGIDGVKLEKIINRESTISIPKSINDLDNKELQEIYGIDRETLLKQKQDKIKELQKYKKLKDRILLKIYHIKNNQFDKIISDHKNIEEKQEEEEDDIYYNNNNMIHIENSKQNKKKIIDDEDDTFVDQESSSSNNDEHV